MGFSFNPLWKLLIDRGMTKEQLRKDLKLSPATIAKMGKSENISLDVIDKICRYFNCRIESIIEYIPESEDDDK